MKCLGAMFFEEQAQIIMYMIFQVLSLIFVSRNILKKQLVHMLIHVRKIFSCKASFQIPLSKCLLIVAKEF